MKKILILLIIIALSHSGFAYTEIQVNHVDRPIGAILFIVDGLGSSYFYPEFTPQALDGSEIQKASYYNLTKGTKIIHIKTPHPETRFAHSVIVTGYSKADPETLESQDSTIFDITKNYGYINLAIMEKGDFSSMRNKQDMIMYMPNNSIKEPGIKIQENREYDDIYEIMNKWKAKMPEYVGNYSGIERYRYYNKWGIDAANSLAKYMVNKKQKFFIIVNIGAIDSGGHYLGAERYVKLINYLEKDMNPLYKTAKDNNIALFFTADHGMSFATKNAKRGGHASKKYNKRNETLYIPFVVISPNSIKKTINGEFEQQDIAPTILSILDLPNNLKYSDGKAINMKNYSSIFVISNSGYKVSLLHNNIKISEADSSDSIFTGLPLNKKYTIKASSSDGNYEKTILTDSDKIVKIEKKEPKIKLDKRKIISIVLIFIVILSGLIIIKKIKDSED